MLIEPLAPWLRDVNRSGAVPMPAMYTPPADVLVKDDEVKVEMDVPGVSADDLEIELENDVLTIRGERRFPYDNEQDDRAWRRVERRFGRFERVLRVPRGLDPNAIDAELHHGVLTVRIPRPEPPQPRRIEIRHDAGASGEGKQGRAGEGEQGRAGEGARSGEGG
ncbi:MAG TPA: Hsp20/alpha crystallin family protein [Solirubrobacteraceae bacterium]